MTTYKKLFGNPTQIWWKVLYLLLMSGGLWLAFSGWAYDDPYITYRYAQNIATGGGFVYNLGERVLSTTTPLFAMLLALFYKAGISMPFAANIISVTSLAFGGLLLWDLAQTWKTPWVGWVGLLLYPTFSLFLATIGSETPLYLALCLGGITLYARGKLDWAAILVALATLTRSDALLIVFVFAGDYFWHNRLNLRERSFWMKLPWKGGGVALGVLVGWSLFAWLYFGSPFPVTLAVKQAQGQMAVSTRFLPGTKDILSWYAPYWPYWLALGLAILGGVYAFTHKRFWMLIFSWTGIYFLAYSLLGVSDYYWYYAPLVPGFLVALGLGLALIERISPSKRIRLSSWGAWFAALLLVILFIAQLFNLNQLRQNPDPRFAIYKAAGEWLAENTSESADVGTLEVGIIGYYAQRPMVGFAGLIQPRIAEQFKADTTYEDIAIWTVKQYQPDYLILFANNFPRLIEKKYITVFCRNAHQLRGRDYQYPADLLIFDCRP